MGITLHLYYISPLYPPHSQRLTGKLTPRLGNNMLADNYTCMMAFKMPIVPKLSRYHLGGNLQFVYLCSFPVVDEKTPVRGKWCSAIHLRLGELLQQWPKFKQVLE
jgi:hypothetical protein